MCAAASCSIACISRFPGVPRAARCERVYPGTQRCIYAGRRQRHVLSSRRPTRLAAVARALPRRRRMRRTMTLATSLLIVVAAEGLAQSSEQDPIRELQNQLEEMRSQMVTMQNRIATLEAAKGTSRGSFTTRRDEERRRTDGIPLQGSHSHSRWVSELNGSGAHSE